MFFVNIEFIFSISISIFSKQKIEMKVMLKIESSHQANNQRTNHQCPELL